MSSELKRNHLLHLPEFQTAISNTLTQYVRSKEGENEQNIWICTINNHGNYLAIMLIDYGSEAINAFPINVAVSTSIFLENLIEETKHFLNAIHIFPKMFIQDGQSINNTSVVAINSCSRTVFSTLKNVDIHDVEYSKFYSSKDYFSSSLKYVPELKAIICYNEMAFGPAGRKENMKFEPAAFSPELGDKLLKYIAHQCRNQNEFNEIEKYIGTLFDIFNIIWERQNMQRMSLELNSKEFIEAVAELPEIKEFTTHNNLIKHHTAILRSLRTFSKLLQEFPNLDFEALTLLVEYYLLELPRNYLTIFKRVVTHGYVADGVNFWLGSTSRKIIYHALICSANDRKNFFIKLKEWSKTLEKTSVKEALNSYYKRVADNV